MKNIVNIINFVRAVEPRPGRNIDLQGVVKEQIRLLRQNHLRGTFLLQYDALKDNDYIELMKSCEDICEAGIWFEVVQPLVEAVGEIWRGRYSWDWYNDVGFLIGYAPEIRRKLIDEAMETFREIFGDYPESVGSWHIDAVSMAYLAEKYHVKACCICRDQVGTDGYTMQGGYYNQAYYPSKKNMFCPANTKENQIMMPVFRMLGSDAIYAYDFQVIDYGLEKCPTLEPAHYGGTKIWCNWFLDETFSGNGLSMQYTQAGQENSFGWPRMGDGYIYQISKIKELADQGKVEVMTLGESGQWYLSQYELTPPGALTALSDWHDAGHKSIWYSSRFYRVNLFWENGVVRIRDLYLFDDSFEEKYLYERCETHACEFRNLPVMDGVLYTNPKERRAAGIYLTDGEKDIQWEHLNYVEKDGRPEVYLSNGDYKAAIYLEEDVITIVSDVSGLSMEAVYDAQKVFGKYHADTSKFTNHNNGSAVITYVTEVDVQKNCITFLFDGKKYGLNAEKGYFEGAALCGEKGTLRIGVMYDDVNKDGLAGLGK